MQKRLTAKQCLCNFPTRMSGGAVRNQLKWETYLKIADIEKIEAKEAEQQKQQGIYAMKKAGNAKADAEAGERKMTNDPKCKSSKKI